MNYFKGETLIILRSVGTGVYIITTKITKRTKDNKIMTRPTVDRHGIPESRIGAYSYYREGKMSEMVTTYKNLPKDLLKFVRLDRKMRQK